MHGSYYFAPSVCYERCVLIMVAELVYKVCLFFFIYPLVITSYKTITIKYCI